MSPPPYAPDWQYEWDVRDHLGNLRLVYNDLNGDDDITSDEIVQVANYYPYGSRYANTEKSALKNQYLYNGIEHVGDFGLELSMATFRNLQSDRATWLSVDPKAEYLYGMSPYQAMNNNPISYADPEGELPFLAFAAIGVFTSGIGNAVKGNNFFDGAISAAIGGALSGGYWAAASSGISGHLPSANIDLGGGFSFSLSPSFAIGGAGDFNVGANASLNYQNGDFGIGIGGGTSYGKNGITGVTGFENRLFGGGSYDNGSFGASISSTQFYSGATSQRVGTLGIRSGDFSFTYDNDNIPGIGDLYDRYRTSAIGIGYKDFSLGLNMFTGDPSPSGYEKGRYGRGPKYYSNEYNSNFRLGALYAGYRGTRLGLDSENIRHIFQNRLVHSGIAKWFSGRRGVPYFKKLNDEWYLYGGSYSKVVIRYGTENNNNYHPYSFNIDELRIY